MMARVRKGDTSAERQPLILIDNPTLGGITVAKSPSHSPTGVLSAIAFHEKAGQCQEQFSFRPYFAGRAASAAILPSALFGERCSLGASWAFSFQSVLPPDYRPRLHL